MIGCKREMPTSRLISLALASICVAFCVGCKSANRPEGYFVTGYDASSQQWTILRTGTFDGKYLKKKLVVRCLFYKSGDDETVQGPDACHLQVGRLIVPTPLENHATPDQFVDVFEMPDEVLSITDGSGSDRVIQQFKILSYTVENP